MYLGGLRSSFGATSAKSVTEKFMGQGRLSGPYNASGFLKASRGPHTVLGILIRPQRIS
jgi:hypothetical protein